VPTYVLVPAFILNELKVAFMIGIYLYIPFIIIDMVVASILMSMGMIMLPPVMISTPFKLILSCLWTAGAFDAADREVLRMRGRHECRRSGVSHARGIVEILLLSAPVLLIAMIVGLVISIFQATTSIQEQTLTFVPKIAAILIVLAILGGWMLGHLAEYTRGLFEMIPQMAR
jgi:flagellar biosynthetic protein FliQ